MIVSAVRALEKLESVVIAFKGGQGLDQNHLDRGRRRTRPEKVLWGSLSCHVQVATNHGICYTRMFHRVAVYGHIRA